MLALLFLSLFAAAASQNISCPSAGAGSVCLVWFAEPGCPANSTASLVAQRNNVCALVPSSFSGVPFSSSVRKESAPRSLPRFSPPPYPFLPRSYKASCTTDGLGGTVEYCASADCTTGCTVSPFTSGNCATNAAAYGSRSLLVVCSPPTASPTPAPPVSGAAAAAVTAVGLLLAAGGAALSLM